MRRSGAAVVLVAVLLWPALDPTPADGFPVSTYPMFARRSGPVVRLATAVGLDADGAVHRLDPHAIGGGDEVVLAAEQVAGPWPRGAASMAAFCDEVADRVDDAGIVAVEVRTEVRDAVADVRGRARRSTSRSTPAAPWDKGHDLAGPARPARRGPAPAGRARPRGGLVGAWLVVRLPHHLGLADLPDRRWYPIGVLAPFDEPPPAWLASTVIVVAIVAGVAAAAGWRPRLSVPVWAAALLLVATYVSCWGQLFHTENVLVLHAVVLAAWALATRPVDPRLVLTALVVALAATYVVAGVAKLRGSGWAWFDGDVLQNKVAFDNVRKALFGAPRRPSPAAGRWASTGCGRPWPR